MKQNSHLFAYCLLFVVTACSSLSAVAEPLCMKDSRSEEEINICQHAAAKALELELNDLESSIRSRFKSPQLERFDDAQTHWQQMTESDCKIEADFYEGAPIYPAIQSECLQRHYQDRMETLNKYVCPEPNLGNGCEVNDPVPVVVLPAPADKRSKRFR